MKFILSVILVLFSISVQGQDRLPLRSSDDICQYRIKNDKGQTVASFDIKAVTKIERPVGTLGQGLIYVQVKTGSVNSIFTIDDYGSEPLVSEFVIQHHKCMKTTKSSK